MPGDLTDGRGCAIAMKISANTTDKTRWIAVAVRAASISGYDGWSARPPTAIVAINLTGVDAPPLAPATASWKAPKVAPATMPPTATWRTHERGAARFIGLTSLPA
jgi:hypothetical protein